MGNMIVVFIDNAIHTILAAMTICAIDTVLAILDVDIGRGILTISTFRSCQANVAFRTILAIDTLDGDAILAILTFDGNAILAVNADTGLTISTIDAHMAVLTIFTVFANTTDVQVIAELQIINLLAIRTRLLSNLKVAIRVGAVRFRSRTAIDSDFRMMLIDTFNLRIYIIKLLIDIGLYLMELVFCSSTAADIRTIRIPGLVIQVSDKLAAIGFLIRSLTVLIIDGQAAVTLCNLANLGHHRRQSGPSSHRQ